MELKDRISEVRKSFGLTQKEFGERIGVAANTVTNYESGNRVPLDAVLVSICREFDIDENWLRCGEGIMIPARTTDEKIAALTGRLLSGDNDFKKKMIGMMLEMSDDEWELVEKFIDKLSALKSDK